MTKTEQGYVAQGYKLPNGWTWLDVARARAKYDIPSYRVPLATASGVVAWGAPMIEGKYLKH